MVVDFVARDSQSAGDSRSTFLAKSTTLVNVALFLSQGVKQLGQLFYNAIVLQSMTMMHVYGYIKFK